MPRVLDGPDWLALQPDDEHRAAWRWIAAHVRPYPRGTYVPPMRPLRPSRKARPLAVLEVQTQTDPETGTPTPAAIAVDTGTRATWQRLEGDLEDIARLESTILTRQTRGRLVLGWGLSRLGFHLLLRHYGHLLAMRGYRLRPIGSATEIKALIISRAKHAWTLVDVGSATGLGDCCRRCFVRTYAPGRRATEDDARRMLRALRGFQLHLLRIAGTPLQMTVGMAAVRAAQRHIPADAWLWRPSPELVALCRAGGGYRGGYVFASPYRGRAHRLDVNRLYTWALAQRLPRRASLGPCIGPQGERPGLYLCRIRGPGHLPIYVAPWGIGAETFKRRLWSGAECLAVVSQAEFAGLRALGYEVDPGWGFVWTATWSLDRFAARLAAVTVKHGKHSPQDLVVKRLANALYGKLGEPSERTELIYATEPPGPDWWPFLTDDGEELPMVWTRARIAHRAHQHVDVAAEVTAHGRGLVYDALARLIAAGSRVVAVDTDGTIVTDLAPDVLDLDPLRIGAWRIVAYDDDAIVPRAKLFVLGGRPRAAGVGPLTREQVEVAWRSGSVEVMGKRMAPPWSDGAVERAVKVRISRARVAV